MNNLCSKKCYRDEERSRPADDRDRTTEHEWEFLCSGKSIEWSHLCNIHQCFDHERIDDECDDESHFKPEEWLTE